MLSRLRGINRRIEHFDRMSVLFERRLPKSVSQSFIIYTRFIAGSLPSSQMVRQQILILCITCSSHVSVAKIIIGGVYMAWAIVSLVLSCVSLFVFWWLGLIGAILGIVGLSTADDNKTQKGLSIAGIVVGILSSMAMLLIMAIRNQI